MATATELRNALSARLAARGPVLSNARSQALAAAGQRVVDPSLSGGQTGFLGQLGAVAGMRGLFGGAVEGSIDSARTQFLAGNRLSGLQALADDFFNFAPRGVSRADLAGGREGANAAGTLSQILGLQNQFNFGAAGGREALNNLDVSMLGGFAARRGRGPFGRGSTDLTLPGTPENELARRVAEGFGADDTGAFIRNNLGPLQSLVRRAGLAGRADFTQGQATLAGFPRVVADDLEPGGAPGPDVAEITRRFLQQQNSGRFGVTANLAGPLRGLSATGLLPFRGGSQQLAESLFSFGV